jgi:hypothetical protein
MVQELIDYQPSFPIAVELWAVTSNVKYIFSPESANLLHLVIYIFVGTSLPHNSTIFVSDRNTLATFLCLLRYFLKVHLHHFSKIKSQEVTKQ